MPRLFHYLLLFVCFVNVPVSQGRGQKYAIVEENGYYKAIDTAGHVVVDEMRSASDMWQAYDVIDEGMFPYLRGGLLGFKNVRNEIVVQPAYRVVPNTDRIYPLSAGECYAETRFYHGLAVITGVKGRFGIIDKIGRLIADTVYDYISPPEKNSVYAARRGDTLYILDRQGKNILRYAWRTDPKLYSYPKFRDGLLCVMARVGGLPYVDYTDSISPDPGDGFGGMDNATSRAAPMHHYKVGFVDTGGRLVIDTVFNMSVSMLGNRDNDTRDYMMSGQMCGFARAQMGRWQPAADPYYLRQPYYIFSGDRCLVSNAQGAVVINTDGKVLFSIPFRGDITNTQGYFIVSERNYFTGGFGGSSAGNEKPPTQCGLIGRDGRIILQQQWGSIQDANEGFFIVSEGEEHSRSRHFFIDTTGRRRFASSYLIADPFDNGYARVYLNKSRGDSQDYGNIDTAGRFRAFSSGNEPAGMAGLVFSSVPAHTPYPLKGIKNKQGQWVVLPRYYSLRPFVNGFALCSVVTSVGERWGYVNSKGEEVIAPRFSRAAPFTDVAVD